jgi:hypothetical protein
VQVLLAALATVFFNRRLAAPATVEYFDLVLGPAIERGRESRVVACMRQV